MIAKRIIISGLVQGVGFRAWASNEALRLGLQGWVRNLEDGSVEALLSGDLETVNAMISLCRQGPRYANVSEIKILEDTFPIESSGFCIR